MNTRTSTAYCKLAGILFTASSGHSCAARVAAQAEHRGELHGILKGCSGTHNKISLARVESVFAVMQGSRKVVSKLQHTR